MGPAALPITPETKVGALLEAYPQLEPLLIEMAPAFRKLQNPVLRRTVGRVASLRQAAAVGGVPLAELVNRLRRAVGEAEVMPETEARVGAKNFSPHHSPPPPWLDRARVARSVDIRPLLEAGQQPIAAVMAELQALAPGELLELVAPFRPEPLLDQATARGFDHWCEARPDGAVACTLHRR